VSGLFFFFTSKGEGGKSEQQNNKKAEKRPKEQAFLIKCLQSDYCELCRDGAVLTQGKKAWQRHVLA